MWFFAPLQVNRNRKLGARLVDAVRPVPVALSVVVTLESERTAPVRSVAVPVSLLVAICSKCGDRMASAETVNAAMNKGEKCLRILGKHCISSLCNRAQPQSCRKDSKINVGFSPKWNAGP